MAVLNAGGAGPTIKADSCADTDLIPKSLDAQITRPTNEADASVTLVFIGFLANPQPSTGLMSLYRLPFESG